ncbi:MAG: helix-turn-helix transcriptional regulator [Deltaproteobacteria bacterium]|jgi:transcriptional regulator with XRE-family HTH domain|nr:helix-turn-helix transcriptional regulator [Deltaproteobacteria bacterium]MBT4526711.1 helix-turn-helix transcriptional regulator [Deltaproteobacteria bacterium]
MERSKSKALKLIETALGEKVGIATLMKAYRTRLGKTQPEIAKTLGTSKSEISDIENMRKLISLERAVTFAQTLGESTKVWAEIAIQDQINKLGLDMVVEVKHKNAS